jgi:hypothetical protein
MLARYHATAEYRVSVDGHSEKLGKAEIPTLRRRFFKISRSIPREVAREGGIRFAVTIWQVGPKTFTERPMRVVTPP